MDRYPDFWDHTEGVACNQTTPSPNTQACDKDRNFMSLPRVGPHCPGDGILASLPPRPQGSRRKSLH